TRIKTSSPGRSVMPRSSLERWPRLIPAREASSAWVQPSSDRHRARTGAILLPVISSRPAIAVIPPGSFRPLAPQLRHDLLGEALHGRAILGHMEEEVRNACLTHRPQLLDDLI